MGRLIPPSEGYRDSYLSALEEFQREERYRELDPAAIAADFDGFVGRWRTWPDPAQTLRGRASETIRWLVEGPAFVGRVSIRLAATDPLRQMGGHIGYEIRPSRRRQEYGGRMLALALAAARAPGLSAALLTCDAGNVGSRAIIERNGGRLESSGVTPETGVPILRYWIDLKPAGG